MCTIVVDVNHTHKHGSQRKAEDEVEVQPSTVNPDNPYLANISHADAPMLESPIVMPWPGSDTAAVMAASSVAHNTNPSASPITAQCTRRDTWRIHAHSGGRQ